jgi:hypothetical protein
MIVYIQFPLHNKIVMMLAEIMVTEWAERELLATSIRFARSWICQQLSLCRQLSFYEKLFF